jgi:hypothetical protein
MLQHFPENILARTSASIARCRSKRLQRQAKTRRLIVPLAEEFTTAPTAKA